MRDVLYCDECGARLNLYLPEVFAASPWRAPLPSQGGERQTQWQRIIAAKGGPCRVCRDPASNGALHALIHFHHLVPRAQGGDDVEDNIVPLCQDCHGLATLRNPLVLTVLRSTLTFEERGYIVGKLGEGGMERLFGAGA